jgi:hypothetical protein
VTYIDWKTAVRDVNRLLVGEERDERDRERRLRRKKDVDMLKVSTMKMARGVLTCNLGFRKNSIWEEQRKARQRNHESVSFAKELLQLYA